MANARFICLDPFRPMTRDTVQIEGEWPEEIMIADEFLKMAGECVAIGDGLATIYERDTQATYGLGRYNASMNLYPAKLLSIEMRDA